MMRRYLLGLNVFAVLAAVAYGPPARAEQYSCKKGAGGNNCQFEASCTDEFYRYTDICDIQCMNDAGGGLLQDTGSADCGDPLMEG